MASWIFFDAADTLLRPEPSVAKAYCDVAVEFEIRRSVEDVEPRFAAARRKYFCDEFSSEELDRQRWQSLVLDVLDTGNLAVLSGFGRTLQIPQAGVFTTMLPRHGWSLSGVVSNWGIASNFDARLLPIVASFAPVNTCEHVFISSQLGYRKPSRQFFRAIEKQLGIDTAVLIGDSLTADFKGAQQAGWTAIHLTRNEAAVSWPKITTLAEVLRFY